MPDALASRSLDRITKCEGDGATPDPHASTCRDRGYVVGRRAARVRVDCVYQLAHLLSLVFATGSGCSSHVLTRTRAPSASNPNVRDVWKTGKHEFPIARMVSERFRSTTTQPLPSSEIQKSCSSDLPPANEMFSSNNNSHTLKMLGVYFYCFAESNDE